MTETWFANSDQHDLEAENLLLGSGIVASWRNRERGARGIAHGGVAVLGREAMVRLEEIQYPNMENFEVLPVKVTVREVKRPVILIAAYIPPGYNVARGRACLQHINDIVLHVKTTVDEPYVCVAGDFNQWLANEALEDYPPTRNNRCIDRIFLNWEVVDIACLPPLEAVSEDGVTTLSDHKVQHLRTKLERKERPVWKKISYRPFSEVAAAAFQLEMEGVEWTPVYQANGTNAKARELQRILDYLMDKYFPVKTIRRKNTDKPWINESTKKKAKRKRAVFREEGKSERWEAMRQDLDEHLERRQEIYLQRQRDNMLGPNAQREFHKNVKNFSTAEKPKSFDVREMRPGSSDQEVANELSEYFNKISREFKPLDPWQIPRTYERDLPVLTPDRVEARLKMARKPSSMVKGDIMPALVNRCSSALSYPLANIYNTIIATNVWPIEWKKEWVTVIPKKTMPESFSELRNISCTMFFSKVFESFLLEFAQEEIGVKNNQYGGTKGCSTSHFLIDVWQQICENAEDYRSSTVLAAIDYSKAFNRLSFQHCLQAFKKKGASTNVIRLIATFLTNRQMTVRVGECWSDPLPVNGGCPQGSVLGVFLFNITTDDLEEQFLRHEERRLGGNPENNDVQHDESLGHVSLDESLEEVGLATSSTPEQARARPPSVDLSPVGEGLYRHSDLIVHFNRYAKNLPQPPLPHFTPQPREEAVGTQVLVEKRVQIRKYVDDNLLVEKLNFGNCPTTVVNGCQLKKKKATGIENAFKSVITCAKHKGMLVNALKTNLICISDSLNYLPVTYFNDDDNNVINSVDNMKLLGFNFSNRPTVHAQVEATCKKLRRKYWSLRHLKKVGFNEEELVKAYVTHILPIADYCSVVYHSMLTDEQDERLENAQVGALRAIFGPGISGRKMRERAEIETLRNRRIRQCDKFAEKCIASPRFSSWFPPKEGRRAGRSTEVYREDFARCDRLKNSPLFYMRRRMNGKEGKSYGERYRIYRER